MPTLPEDTPSADRVRHHIAGFDLQDVDWVAPSNRQKHCAIFMNKVFQAFDTGEEMRAFCEGSNLLFTMYCPPTTSAAVSSRGVVSGLAG
jgi:hypothetical protein